MTQSCPLLTPDQQRARQALEALHQAWYQLKRAQDLLRRQDIQEELGRLAEIELKVGTEVLQQNASMIEPKKEPESCPGGE